MIWHSVKYFFLFSYCVSLGNEIQWICQLDEVFYSDFTTIKRVLLADFVSHAALLEHLMSDCLVDWDYHMS